MIYLWHSIEEVEVDEFVTHGWELAGRLARVFNEDTKQVTDDTGHVHYIIKRAAKRNVIRGVLTIPTGLLDDETGPDAERVALRDYLFDAYLNKTELLFFDEDKKYYYRGYITNLDENVTSNQVFFAAPKTIPVCGLVITEDGHWTTWLDIETLTETTRE